MESDLGEEGYPHRQLGDPSKTGPETRSQRHQQSAQTTTQGMVGENSPAANHQDCAGKCDPEGIGVARHSQGNADTASQNVRAEPPVTGGLAGVRTETEQPGSASVPPTPEEGRLTKDTGAVHNNEIAQATPTVQPIQGSLTGGQTTNADEHL